MTPSRDMNSIAIMTEFLQYLVFLTVNIARMFGNNKVDDGSKCF